MNMKPHHTLFVGAACMLLGCTAMLPAAAQPALADPTQPPGLVQPVAATRTRSGAADAAPVWPLLQSVQVSASGSSSALIDGRVVRVGDRLGEMSVVAIDAQGILLRGSRYDQRLALLPGLVKTSSARAPLAPRPAVAVATKEIP